MENKLFAPNRLKEVRKSLGFTLKELGDAVGVTFATISKLENRQMGFTIDYLNQISESLDVSVTELLVVPSNDFKPEYGASPKAKISTVEDARTQIASLLKVAAEQVSISVVY